MRINVITVCGCGLGTSLMLLMDVQSIGKKQGIEVRGEAVDLGTARSKSPELFITSEEIAKKLDVEKPLVAIKNILDKKEIEDKVIPVIKEIIERRS
ncbi:PTS sugar transporter subunit IIB [Clostridium oceanicum]|uniref:PTS sugar transporter subunit IIB n=1 Tax=Clostridium oceanicum TaxID=1543 RepID=A0ABP3UWV5_9CLOT